MKEVHQPQDAHELTAARPVVIPADTDEVTSSVVTPTAELPRGPVTEETVSTLLAVGASGEVVDLARELARR